jgi:methionyl aminopeptidase
VRKYRGIFLKNDQEIAALKESCQIAAIILRSLGDLIEPGLPTIELENHALKLCDDYKAEPAFKGYMGFPFAVCCSINEEVVHGFPSERQLQPGDIVSLDFGVKFNGFYGDTAKTYPVGDVHAQAHKLMQVTQESLYKGIEQAVVGNDLYDISRAVQEHVQKAGMGIVAQFVGHGIGRQLHEKPEVPNFVPRNCSRVPLKAGMVLAIEPMVTSGSPDVAILSDGWTAISKDRSLAAHFEHSVAITKDGPLILSQLEN